MPGGPRSDRDLEKKWHWTQCHTVSPCVRLCHTEYDTVWHNLPQCDTIWNYLGRDRKPSSDLVCLVIEIGVESQSPERWRLEACHRQHRWTGIKFKLYCTAPAQALYRGVEETKALHTDAAVAKSLYVVAEVAKLYTYWLQWFKLYTQCLKYLYTVTAMFK